MEIWRSSAVSPCESVSVAEGAGEWAMGCLLCWAPCDASFHNDKQSEDSGAYLELPSAEGNGGLGKELSAWFILRKVLDLPLEWCEVTLREEGPQNWFMVCEKCLHTQVSQIWKLHEQVLQLQRIMEAVKVEVKRRIRQSAEMNKSEEPCGGDAMEIRNLVALDLAEILQRQGEADTLQVKIEVKLSAVESEGEDMEELDAGLMDTTDDDSTDDWLPTREDLNQVPQEGKRIAEKKSKNEGEPKTLERIAAKKCIPKNYPGKQAISANTVNASEEEDASGEPALRKRLLATDIKMRKRIKGRTTRKHGRSVYPCGDCKVMRFRSPEELDAHQQLHAQRKETPALDPEGNSLDCAKCSYPARDQQDLTAHVLMCHENCGWDNQHKHECPLRPPCTKTPDKWGLVIAHIAKCHSDVEKELMFDKYLRCDQCPFQGDKPIELRVHIRKTHKRLSSVPKQILKCNHCDILCTSEKQLKIHVNNEHRRVSRFVCEQCGKGFMYQRFLLSHEVTRTKHLNRDWVCDVCGVNFSNRKCLNFHWQAYHSEEALRSAGEKVYSCRHCPLTRPFNAVIRKHLQTHKVEGDWKCEQCSNFYMNKQGLLRHQRINHNESAEQVKCPHCQRPFPSKDYLQRHVKYHCKLKGIVESLEGTNALSHELVSQSHSAPGSSGS